MNYYYGPYENGTLFFAQMLIISSIIGLMFGGFKYGLLAFVILLICSSLPYLSTFLRYILAISYGGIGYLFGQNEAISFIIFYVLIGLLIGFFINFGDYNSMLSE